MESYAVEMTRQGEEQLLDIVQYISVTLRSPQAGMNTFVTAAAKDWTGTTTATRLLSFPKVHIRHPGWLSPAFLSCPFLCILGVRS